MVSSNFKLNRNFILTEMTTATGTLNCPAESLLSVSFLMTCVKRVSVLALLRMAFLSSSRVISTAIVIFYNAQY